MEEVQRWWEVPAVAHFCYAFREVFNLFYLEIGELESAILNIQDPEMCISLEQLITRLLQGCYEADTVTSENWEEKLKELFEENCEDEKNPFMNKCPFYNFPSRNKVEVLMKLCEFRLDADGAFEAIKDVPAEDMQAKCIGKDSHNNSYWYFCDERLYKERQLDKVFSKKISVTTSKKSKNVLTNGKPSSSRGRKEKDSINGNESWAIACYNVSDWEKLAKTFSKSKNSEEQALSNVIKSEYLDFLHEVVSEKDRLLRKRFMELAPKRTSSRISRVQSLKKIEEEKAAQAAEEARIKFEQEQAKKEVARKKLEKEERQKRAEERHKSVEERALRLKAREQIRHADNENWQDEDFATSRKRGSQVQNGLKKQKRGYSSSEESESEDGSDEEEVNQSRSDSEESDSEGSDCENESETVCSNWKSSKLMRSNSLKQSNAPQTLLITKISSTEYAKQNMKNCHDSNQWTSTIDSKGRKTLIFKDSNQFVANKKAKTESINSRNENVKEIKTMYKVTSPYKESFITYGKIDPSPSIIRLNFVK